MLVNLWLLKITVNQHPVDCDSVCSLMARDVSVRSKIDVERMQLYGDRTSTESSTEQSSRDDSARGDLGLVDGHRRSKPRLWQRLRIALRRPLDHLLHRLAKRTSGPDVCNLCLLCNQLNV